MIWRKLGLVFRPDGSQWWARSYATIPTALVLDERRLRVYYAALDERRHGRIGYVDLDARDPRRLVGVARQPVLDIGELGAFDDSGVNASCVLRTRDAYLLYYIGWQRCERVPYMLFTGLATSEDGERFARVSRVPVLDRSNEEPFSRSAPFAREAGDGFDLWYWSCRRWSEHPAGTHYNNVIRYLRSPRADHWPGSGRLCLQPRDPEEYSLGRPWVLSQGDRHQMWFSARSHGGHYRIGYAQSSDLMRWERNDDQAGLQPSADGWDSEMVCYPSVIDCQSARYLFYNGNRHGFTGFGCAVLEQD